MDVPSKRYSVRRPLSAELIYNRLKSCPQHVSRCLAHSLYLSPGIADPIADVERRKEEKERREG